MKRIESFVAIAAFIVALAVLVPATASAAPDPLCIGVTPPTSVDLSSGTARLCFPSVLADGEIIAETKVLTCTVVFFDGADTLLSTEVFTGEAGSLHLVPVPRDGVGTSSMSCTLDDLIGATAVVAVTFPVDSVPNPPVFLP